jgi:hypothetical protein
MPATAHRHEVLSLEAMKDDPGWEAALNWPFPPNPGFYLLEEARRHIITYLDWVTHDLARGPIATRDRARRGALARGLAGTARSSRPGRLRRVKVARGPGRNPHRDGTRQKIKEM